MGFNVCVTRQVPESGIVLLREHCEVVDVNPEDRVMDREELMKFVRGRHGVLCVLNDRIDAEVMEAAGPQCKVFSNYAVGTDNIDVLAASKRGIAATNTPGVLTDATADLAWALLMAVSRRIVEADRFTRAGKFDSWAPMLFLGGDLAEQTLGIVGAGRIGSAVAERAVGFRMKVLYTARTPKPDLEKKTGARRVDLETLLRESDLISLHVPLTPATRHLVGERELALMKPSAYLINTSRGAVVDETALVAALSEKRIAGAGLDVFEDEPTLAPGLASLENVVVLPHIGSATIGTRSRMSEIAARNLLAVLKHERPPHCVNPEVLT